MNDVQDATIADVIDDQAERPRGRIPTWSPKVEAWARSRLDRVARELIAAEPVARAAIQAGCLDDLDNADDVDCPVDRFHRLEEKMAKLVESYGERLSPRRGPHEPTDHAALWGVAVGPDVWLLIGTEPDELGQLGGRLLVRVPLAALPGDPARSLEPEILDHPAVPIPGPSGPTGGG